jgi:hypothetical protein
MIFAPDLWEEFMADLRPGNAWIIAAMGAMDNAYPGSVGVSPAAGSLLMHVVPLLGADL